MKKIMILLLSAVVTGSAATAQTDSMGIEYRYYPEANVYFNPGTKTYSWFDQSRASWTTGIQLPSSFKVGNTTTFNTVRYPGTDIWTANPDHIKLYGNKNNQVPPINSTNLPPRKKIESIPPF